MKLPPEGKLKMHKFEIVLKNEKERTYFIISCLLLYSNFISLLLLTIAIDFTKLGPFILSILSMLSLYLGWYLKRSNEKQTLYAPFLFFSLAWFSSPYLWLGFANLFFQILDATSRRKLNVQFYNDKIIYPSVFRKNILWTEVNNAILKDGILTLDFKNNKLIQQYIDQGSTSINEKEFNEFCNSRLNLAH